MPTFLSTAVASWTPMRGGRGSEIVGRREELLALASTLRGGTAPSLCYLHGPGGVGKTTLLHAWMASARKARFAVGFVDARRCEPTPDSLTRALAEALGARGRQSLRHRLRSLRRRPVLVV